MGTRTDFSGDLGFIGLPDILQIVGGNRGTGVLNISSPRAAAPGRIFFVEGAPVNADIGPLNGTDAAYALFGWTEGRFEFREGPVRVPRTIKKSRMQLTLDALRMLDEGLIPRERPEPGPEVFLSTGDPAGPAPAPVRRGPFVDYTYVVQEEMFPDGTTIVRQGAHGNWMWVILDGNVRIIRETPHGPVTLAVLGEGCFIGTLISLLHGENTRSATVTAVGDVQLGLLDTQRLSGEYASLSPEFRCLIMSVARRLGKITENTVGLVLQTPGEPVHPRDGRLIMPVGCPEEKIYVITEGRSYVLGKSGSTMLPLVTLHRKDVFGSLPFPDLGHEPGHAAVVGSADLEVEKLDPDPLKKEYETLSSTFRNLLDDLGNCVSQTTRMAYRFSSGTPAGDPESPEESVAQGPRRGR